MITNLVHVILHQTSMWYICLFDRDGNVKQVMISDQQVLTITSSSCDVFCCYQLQYFRRLDFSLPIFFPQLTDLIFFLVTNLTTVKIAHNFYSDFNLVEMFKNCSHFGGTRVAQ